MTRLNSGIITILLLVFAPASHAAKLVVFAADKPTDGAIVLEGLKQPFAIDFDRAGNAFIADMTGNRVWKIDANGKGMLLAGTGEKGDAGDGGPAAKAQFNGPHSLAVTPDGDVLVADTWNNRIRKIDGKTGVVTPFAGAGKKGFAGDDGPAAQAQFGGVYCIAPSPDWKRLFVADLDNRRIRAIDVATGIVATVAGNGPKGVPSDGSVAKEAPLFDPRAVAADKRGNVYILERSGHGMRVVNSEGRIYSLAGTGKPGLTGDAGPARTASLSGPKHLCLDRDGTVLIADTENHCIRRYSLRLGTIARVAGSGKKGSSKTGGSPTDAELSQPHGVTVSPDGTIFVCDSSNHRILKLVP